MTPPTTTIIITPEGQTGLADWRELWSVRDLWGFLVRRDIKTRYSQSILGLGWAIIQPLFTMVVLTLVFGKLAHLPSDGVPYAVFSLTGVVVWTFFQSAVNEASNSLAANLNVITKVYFPRLVLPLAGVTGKLFDLAIMLVMLAIVMACYHIAPGAIALLAVPAALLEAVLAAVALGLFLSALSVQYRDVRVGQNLLLQILFYFSSVIFSAQQVAKHVPEKLLWLYYLNPLADAVETMRAGLLGTGPVPWGPLGLGAVVTLVGLWGGIRTFHRAARIVADVA